MRYKKKKPPTKEKRLSRLFTNEQFLLVKRIYPHVSNPTLSIIIGERLGIKISTKSLENLAWRQHWHKSEDEVSDVRRENAKSTNEKRWGYNNE